jgi:DNA end-binding protein Ku
MKSKGVVTPVEEEPAEETTTNVVDFMDLLRKSLASNKRTPSSRRASKSAKPRRKAARKTRRKSA